MTGLPTKNTTTLNHGSGTMTINKISIEMKNKNSNRCRMIQGHSNNLFLDAEAQMSKVSLIIRTTLMVIGMAR